MSIIKPPAPLPLWPTIKTGVASANSILLPASTKLEKPLGQMVRYLVLSDIHLGCKRNPATEMLKGLRALLGDLGPTGPMTELDILFIAGDLFDAALWFSNEDVTHILLFMREMMAWCSHHHIRLRVLEGTPSHDRQQSRNLAPIAQTFQSLDFRYIETMCVEGFYDLGITCLYVPDEFGGSALKSQALIQEELDRLGYPQVDIAIMHGMFKYQVPELGSDRFKYDERFFLDRVKYFINIGHVHVFTTYERIIAQGSTDRISHGEEAAKGGCLQVLDPLHGSSFYFLENKQACLFVTLHVRIKDLDKAVAMARKKAQSLPGLAHLRIKAPAGHPILNLFDALAREFPMVFFTKITEEEETDRNRLLTEHDLLNVDYTPIHITRENIVSMVMQEVQQLHHFPSVHLQKLEDKLRELSH